MKVILFLFTTLLSITLSANLIQAQTLGGSFMLGSPQGEFRENVDRLGYGFQIHGTLWTPGKLRPFTVGLNLGYMVYGEESSSRPLSYTIPDVYVDVDRTNSIANFHLLFQVTPFTGTWRPYIEGLFGGAYIFTTTTVESQWSDEDVFETTNFDDFTWSYGAGGGLLIQLIKDEMDLSWLFLDLKVRYVFGTNAQYLREGDIVVNPATGFVTYYISESTTDLLTFHVGVVAYF
jgi:hypothetical protein